MSDPGAIWGKLTDWAWALLILIFGWAWRLNDRVTRLEMEHKATACSLGKIEKSIHHMDEKLDKLMDKLT